MRGKNKLDYLPADYYGIKVVDSLSALFNTPFGDANAILYPRTLSGDFNRVAQHLAEVRASGYYDRLEKIADKEGRSAIGRAARTILQDIEAVSAWLRAECLPPDIRLRDNRNWNGSGVERFHVDSAASQQLGRILCCYTAPTTQWIKNEDAIQTSGSTFRKARGAPVYSFRPGDIFRIKSLPRNSGLSEVSVSSFREDFFVHRAPSSTAQELARGIPRLLWVAG